jgi:hypothetical protein
VTATSTKTGVFALRGLVNGQDVQNGVAEQSSPQKREWVCSADQGDLSVRLSITPATLPAGGTAVGDVHVVDRFGNVCGNVEPSQLGLSSAPEGLSVLSGPTADAANPGHYGYNLTADPPDTTKFTVTAAYGSAQPASAEVTFERAAGPTKPDAVKSWIEAVASDGSLPVYVAETYTVTAQARDDQDRPVVGATVQWQSPAGAVFDPDSCQTNDSGACAVTVTTGAARRAGDYDVTAVADGVTIATHKTWPTDQTREDGLVYQAAAAPWLRFWAGPNLDPSKSTFLADPTEQTVGADVDLIIIAKDAYDNPIYDLVADGFAIVGRPTDPTTNPAIGPREGTFARNVAYNHNGRVESAYRWKTTSQRVGEFAFEADVAARPAGSVPERISLTQRPTVRFTAGQPDPDILIRPGGEKRVSNFLTWQTAYSELMFFDVLWPDFAPKHIEQAIDLYNERERRYGGV